MPRKRRDWDRGACYHITHRCQDRQLLFRYAKYRDFYTKMLLKSVQRYRMDVLDYIVTSNHVHLLVSAKEGQEISDALRYLHGRMGQWYNREKGHSGSFWSDRFHTTRIQNGEHLARCLIYIDLNMVRAGVVKHPGDWRHSGFSEIRKGRERCRIINIKRLLDCLCIKDKQTLLDWHECSIMEKINKQELKKEKYWSNSIAVGESAWLDNLISNKNFKRQKIIHAGNVCYISGAPGGFSKGTG
jgi:REP-associated tyrosine transposase